MKFLNSNYKKGYANFAKKPKPKASNFDVPFIQNPAVAPGKDLTKSEKLKATIAAEKASAQSRIAQEKAKRYGGSSSPSRPAPKEIRISNGNLLDDAKEAGSSGLKKAGKFIKNNKVGVGLAAAGALGAVGSAVGYGVYRKMRSDKGKKRGQYSK